MGVAARPRLYVDGYAYWNPTTFNNNDSHPTYDTANATLNWAFLSRQGVDSADSFATWAIRPLEGLGGEVVPPCEWNYFGGNQCGFISAQHPSIENDAFTKPPGGTLVTGFTDVAGRYVGRDARDPGAAVPQDPWLGLQVQLNLGMSEAKLVDVNPECFWSSQVFADTLSLGDSTGGTGFTARLEQRMHARYLNLSRNLDVGKQHFRSGRMATVFQCCARDENVRFIDSHPPPGSVQAQLQDVLRRTSVVGLMFRFTCYNTLYYQGPPFAAMAPGDEAPRMAYMAKLYEQYRTSVEAFRKGMIKDRPTAPANRTYSRTVGWIGPWVEGELISAPGGRLLQSGSRRVVPANLPNEQYQHVNGNPPAAEVSLGPAFVEVTSEGGELSRITVDLGATLPETDSKGAKADFGKVELRLAHPDAKDPLGLSIARLPNDQASYEKTAAVFDIDASTLSSPVSLEDVATNAFTLVVESLPVGSTADAGGKVPSSGPPAPPEPRPVIALHEVALRAETDQRGVYIDEPDAPWALPSEPPAITILVSHLGGPPPQGTKLALTEYATTWSWVASWTRTVPEDPSRISPFVQIQLAGHDGYHPIESGALVDVPPDGRVTIALRALRPGFPNIGFTPVSADTTFEGPDDVRPPGDVVNAFYAVARVLPFHNTMAMDFENWLKVKNDGKSTPSVALVNQRVFDDVYRYFSMLYPVMDFIFSPLKLQAWRGRILEATSPSRFESAAYMPVTRCLSTGQRRILELYDAYVSAPSPGARPPAFQPRRRPR